MPRPAIHTTVETTDTSATSLKSDGGITAGTGAVGIVDTTGKIPLISSTYFASLSGANLTGIPTSAVSSGNFVATVASGTGITSSVTSGNAAATAISLVTPVALANGGTAAAITAAAGGVAFSTASAINVTSAGTSGTVLRSGGSGSPGWSTATYPSTAGTSGNVLTSDGTNWASTALPSTGVTLLYANTGTGTLGAPGNWDTRAISGLTAKDRLLVYATLVGSAGTTLLYHNTDGVTLATGNTGTSATHGNLFQYALGQGNLTSNIGVMAESYSGADVLVGTAAIVSVTTTWQSAWTIALRTDTGGTSIYWMWQIYKLPGQ